MTRRSPPRRRPRAPTTAATWHAAGTRRSSPGCGRGLRRPLRSASDELATPVHDRARGHVDGEGDGEQHEAGGDQGATAEVVGLAEPAGDVRGDRDTARAE